MRLRPGGACSLQQLLAIDVSRSVEHGHWFVFVATDDALRQDMI
jgi:hypothetical protein